MSVLEVLLKNTLTLLADNADLFIVTLRHIALRVDGLLAVVLLVIHDERLCKTQDGNTEEWNGEEKQEDPVPRRGKLCNKYNLSERDRKGG